MDPHRIETIPAADGAPLAFARTGGGGPTIMFLHGFHSDMGGTKAAFLHDRARERGQAYLRMDCRGHGQSGGLFEDGTIGAWLDDVVRVMDSATQGPVLLVGSSMGGWLALLAARARPERVAALALIAPAPDFTDRLLWPELPPEAQAAIHDNGFWMRPSSYGDGPYPITRQLLEEAQNHLILTGPVAFRGPVRILHGQADEAVPWGLSLELAERLESEDVRVTFLKAGDHRLSTPADLDLLDATVVDLSRTLGATP